MFALRSLTRRWNPMWFVVVGLAALSALAITTSSSEAAHEFGDAVSSTGVVSNKDEAAGPDDTVVAVLEPGATVTVTFDDNLAFNGAGDDLTLHFQNAGGLAGVASADVEVSVDGTTFVPLASVDDSTDHSFDLTGTLEFVTAVRVTNAEPPAGEGEESVLLELDAVEAIHTVDLEALTIELDPPDDSNPIHSEHDVTATVSDGSPVEGIELTWLIASGPNAGGASTDLTDASGLSELNYTGDGGVGVDEIVAFLDLDGDGVHDEGEPAGTASKRWLGVTGTIDLIDIDGDIVALGDVLTVRVEDADLDLTDAPDTVMVEIENLNAPSENFMLELTETDVHSGVFEGSFFLGSTTDGNTTELAASVGDEIQATYEDEWDDAGEGPTDRQTSLTVEAETDEAGDKVTLCHVPGGNPSNQHTISVGAPARLAHLAHGDSLGECGAAPVDDDHPKQDFCEKRDDHPRCKDQQLDEETLGAGEEVGEDDGKPSGVQALCERRPDHRKCADGSEQNLDALGGDDEEEEEDD